MRTSLSFRLSKDNDDPCQWRRSPSWRVTPNTCLTKRESGLKEQLDHMRKRLQESGEASQEVLSRDNEVVYMMPGNSGHSGIDVMA